MLPKEFFKDHNKEEPCKFLFYKENFQFRRFKWLNGAKTAFPRSGGSLVLLGNHGVSDKVVIAPVMDLPITSTKEKIYHKSFDISERIHSYSEGVEGVSERKLAIEETMRPGFCDSQYLKYSREYFNQKGWDQNFTTCSHKSSLNGMFVPLCN